MKNKDNKLEVLLLAIAIVSHLVCLYIGVDLIEDLKDPLFIPLKFVMLFPIIGELCVLIVVVSENVLIIVPVVIHLIALYFFFVLKYAKLESLSEKITYTDKGMKHLGWILMTLFIPIFVGFGISLTEYLEENMDLIKYDIITTIIFFVFIGLALFMSVFVALKIEYLIHFYLVKKNLMVKENQKLLPKTYKSIMNSRCSACNSKINENSIFGNSLIIEGNDIVIKCVKCRTGLVLTFKKYPKRINRVNLVLKMEKYSGNNMLGILYSLRILNFSLGKSPDESRWNRSFRFSSEHRRVDKDEEENAIEIRYGVLSGNICGECGYYFQNDSDLNNNEEFIQNGECSNCKLPNKHQWFLRTTFETERAELINNKRLEQPIVVEKIEDRILRERKLADAETQLHEAKLQLEKDPENKAFQRKLRVMQAVYDAHKGLADIKNKS